MSILQDNKVSVYDNEILKAMRERDKTTEIYDQVDVERRILLETLNRIHSLGRKKEALYEEALRRNDLVISLQRLQERFENGEKTRKREPRRPNH